MCMWLQVVMHGIWWLQIYEEYRYVRSTVGASVHGAWWVGVCMVSRGVYGAQCVGVCVVHGG